MKKLIILLSGCFVVVPVFAQYAGDYEPFSYVSGDNLIGQTNASYTGAGASWYEIGTSGAAAGPSIGSANLSYSGLATSGGGGASFGSSASSESAMMNLSSSVSSGSIYFSYELQLTGTGSLSTTPAQLTAFTQLTGGKNSLPSRGSIVVAEDDGLGTGFYVGMMRGGQNGNTSADKSEIQWIGGGSGVTASGTLFSYDATLLIVGDWNFSPTATDDDTADLWVNPDASTLGAASAPDGNVTADDSGAHAVKDLTTAASIALIQDTDAPDGEIDDLRVGLAWADVTPAAAPEPSTLAFGALVLAGFCLARFRRK